MAMSRPIVRMAVAAMVLQRDRGRPPAGAFVGMGGWYDLEATGVPTIPTIWTERLTR